MLSVNAQSRYTVNETESSPKTINVEVAYAEPEKQLILPVNVDEGTTVGGAIVQSGIMMHFPDLDIENSKVGIFGKVTPMTTVLRDGDRVEIYRPLIADPKEVRRKRAAEGKATKKGGDGGAEK
ncbi:MAG: RnfH family protein [Gammaproteobacteria bacterium]|nr:RnfH family protein [Gammaproteobacteria bacterium]